MIRYENHCCDCAVPGYPCIGDSCHYVNVPVYYCDSCNDWALAQYDVEDNHYCEKHAKEYMKKIFEELTLSEQAEVLKIDIKSLEG